ncbi:DUF4399 domain-containing protein [Rhodoblastus acidophilus]|uniref:DUF4399 domain-containing protein n=1 Tax=Candidatus Rhodoblastus alkanivorans TaxID=2954117 RepID=A0ABS9Z365_9HYPH|nr:DUF4399 domain-containing protein [Candidatus Rhodoblastus alkanivorans]MCI4678042.1 DUF4399 domain-containing protein [Candidatus Rhodoblastus alkanivorans]MCI4681617.1 DUF4399 domain-containing protein [Candidatus Rhodoblastus alkanivorans]MDI4642665.1 DUF4399 domain-containing protein [Rhodoblastus acidophilus]
MRKILASVFAAALFGLSPGILGAASAESHWPASARVYFIEPANGAVVNGKVAVKFGLSGMGVAPAGVDKPNTAHHHLLIDMGAPTGAALNQPLPSNAHIKHFGGGQTETVLDLPPGKHSLQLIMGDAFHIPHDPPLESEKIEIEVK